MVLIGAGSSLGCMAVYRAESVTGKGYSETRLEDDTFKVVYTGDQYTRPDRREAFLLYRCAQLTAQHGYEHFVILQTNTQINHLDNLIHGNEAFPTVLRDKGHFPRAANSSSTVDGQNLYRSYALIKMFDGSKANVSVSYNAKEVMAHLSLKVYGEREIVRNPPSNNRVSQEAREVVGNFQ
jgi:hypothetical protein